MTNRTRLPLGPTKCCNPGRKGHVMETDEYHTGEDQPEHPAKAAEDAAEQDKTEEVIFTDWALI